MFYPENEKSIFNWHGVRTWHIIHWNHNLTFNETENNLAYDFRFKNTSFLTVDIRYRQLNLPLPTSFLGNFTPLQVVNYNFTQFGLEYGTDNRKLFSSDFRASYGDFYNGNRLNLLANAKLRFQPWVILVFPLTIITLDYPTISEKEKLIYFDSMEVLVFQTICS